MLLFHGRVNNGEMKIVTLKNILPSENDLKNVQNAIKDRINF